MQSWSMPANKYAWSNSLWNEEHPRFLVRVAGSKDTKTVRQKLWEQWHKMELRFFFFQSAVCLICIPLNYCIRRTLNAASWLAFHSVSCVLQTVYVNKLRKFKCNSFIHNLNWLCKARECVNQWCCSQTPVSFTNYHLLHAMLHLFRSHQTSLSCHTISSKGHLH